MPIWLNVVLFQTGWFAAVVGASWGYAWGGPLAACLIVPIHFFLSSKRKSDLSFIIVCFLIGLVTDSALFVTGLFETPHRLIAWSGTPLWMLSLWILFGTLFNHSLAWIKGRWILAGLLGLLGGPLAYAGGERLGALTAQASASYYWVAVQWALAMTLLALLPDKKKSSS